MSKSVFFNMIKYTSEKPIINTVLIEELETLPLKSVIRHGGRIRQGLSSTCDNILG